MKKLVIAVMAVVMCGVVMGGATGEKISSGLSQSVANFLVAPAEIPAGVLVGAQDYGVPGLFSGFFKGIALSATRAVSAMGQFFTLNLLPDEDSPYAAMHVTPISLDHVGCIPQAFPAPAK